MDFSKLQSIMSQKGINRKQLAEGIGMSQNNVGLIYNGRRAPRMDTMHKIAGFLDCEIGDLFRTSNQNTITHVIHNGIFYTFKTKAEFKEFAHNM